MVVAMILPINWYSSKIVYQVDRCHIYLSNRLGRLKPEHWPMYIMIRREQRGKDHLPNIRQEVQNDNRQHSQYQDRQWAQHRYMWKAHEILKNLEQENQQRTSWHDISKNQMWCQINNKIISTPEMATLEAHRIGNHINIDTIEVIEDIRLDQIVRIKVNRPLGEINPTILIITHLCKRPGHSVY